MKINLYKSCMICVSLQMKTIPYLAVHVLNEEGVVVGRMIV